MRYITKDTTDTHIQLMTVRISYPRATKSEYKAIIKTLQQVDPCAIGTAGHLTRESLNSVQYYNLNVTVNLVLQDEKCMKKYRKAMFKLHLAYPTLYTQGISGGKGWKL